MCASTDTLFRTEPNTHSLSLEVSEARTEQVGDLSSLFCSDSDISGTGCPYQIHACSIATEVPCTRGMFVSCATPNTYDSSLSPDFDGSYGMVLQKFYPDAAFTPAKGCHKSSLQSVDSGRGCNVVCTFVPWPYKGSGQPRPLLSLNLA